MTISKFKFEKACKVVENLTGDIKKFYNQSWLWGRSRQWIKRQEEGHITDTDNYRRLPQWASYAYYVVADQCHKEWTWKWIWTHVTKGVRYYAWHKNVNINEVIENDKTPGNLHCSLHCFLYQLEGRIIYVPTNDDEVENEIQSGRLNKDDLKAIHCGKARPIAVEGHRQFVISQPIDI